MMVAAETQVDSLRVEVADTEASFLGLQATWEALLDRSDTATVFSSFAWASVCWRRLRASARPYILQLYDGPVLVGLAPLCITSNALGPKVVRFIATGSSKTSYADYLDFVSAAGFEKRVVRATLSFLEAQKARWQVFDWPELSETSASYRVLSEAAGTDGRRLTLTPGTVCHAIPLPPTWSEFLAQLPPNMRSAIERKTRKIARECGATFEQATSDEDVQSALSALFAFQKQRWPRVKETDVAGFQGFSREMAQTMLRAGRLDLWSLRAGGQAIAVAWNYRLKDTVYFYLSSFDQDERWNKYSIGTILLAFCVRNAIETGCRRFDMMRGDYSYKSRFASVPHRNYRVQLSSSATVARLYRAVDLQRVASLKLRRRVRDLLGRARQRSGRLEPSAEPLGVE
jgi:CelD/BcsL family acetyltransferase involved in cellulose biosynthesis